MVETAVLIPKRIQTLGARNLSAMQSSAVSRMRSAQTTQTWVLRPRCRASCAGRLDPNDRRCPPSSLQEHLRCDHRVPNALLLRCCRLLLATARARCGVHLCAQRRFEALPLASDQRGMTALCSDRDLGHALMTCMRPRQSAAALPRSLSPASPSALGPTV